MNRPLERHTEEHRRSRRHECAAILAELSTGHSLLQGKCDAEKHSSYPARIMLWQFEEGLLGLGQISEKVTECQSEYARRLALFLIADECGTSPEYLRKLCRKHEALRPKPDVVGIPGDDNSGVPS